jgi:hypothetical protein
MPFFLQFKNSFQRKKTDSSIGPAVNVGELVIVATES